MRRRLRPPRTRPGPGTSSRCPGTSPTGTSALNFQPGDTVSNAVLAPVSNGHVNLWNQSPGVQIVADVQGWLG